MIKKITMMLALVALMAAPAFASVQNVKVGGDIKTTSILRSNFTSAGMAAGQDSQNVALSQVGINIGADLTDNVSTMLRLGNERIWGEENATNTDLNIDTAYVTMKELLYSPLTVTVGRQPLAYGNQFLVGDVNAYTDAAVSTVSDLTGGVNADAVKAVLSYDPLTVDLFAAKISEDGVALNDKDDANLYGIILNYKVGDKMSTVVEGYTFVKIDDHVIATAEPKSNKLYVPGLRVSMNPVEGLNVQMEGAYQFGDASPDASYADKSKVSAYGLQGIVNYALPVMKDMKPVVSGGYTYLSGDKNTDDNKYHSFNSLYENQNGGRIFDALAMASSNAKIATLAAEITPLQDITTKLSWYNLSLVNKGATGGLKLGNEADLDVTYAYTEDVKFAVSGGIFFPGKYFDGLSTKDNATQVLTSVNVLF